MELRIRETISKSYLPYTRKCEDAYEMLVKLKDRFKPTNDMRKEEVIAKYFQLQHPPKNHDQSTWLQKWDEVFDEGDDLGIPHMKENQPLKDFINAVEEADTGFHSYWKQHIRNTKANELPSLHEIVQRFRETRPRPKPKGSAFSAIFQGQTAEDGDNDTQKKKDGTTRKREYVCGKKHLFKYCYYLIESRRPADWKPDLEVQKAIEAKL